MIPFRHIQGIGRNICRWSKMQIVSQSFQTAGQQMRFLGVFKSLAELPDLICQSLDPVTCFHPEINSRILNSFFYSVSLVLRYTFNDRLSQPMRLFTFHDSDYFAGWGGDKQGESEEPQNTGVQV